MSKPIRILTAILASLAIGGMFAYQDAQKNAPTYQQHPVTVILTCFFCGSLSGLIFYFGSGWLARRKERKFEKIGDVKFYEEVARELQEEPMVPGLWTKAYAEMGGDDAKARALYIRYRVLQLRDMQVENTRLQAKEARLAAEAAKPPLSKFEKFTISISTMLIGFLTLILIIATVGCIIDKEYFIDTNATYGDTIPYVLVLGALTSVCGWVTRKGYKATTR